MGTGCTWNENSHRVFMVYQWFFFKNQNNLRTKLNSVELHLSNFRTEEMSSIAQTDIFSFPRARKVTPPTWLNMERILFFSQLLPSLRKRTSSRWMNTRYVHSCGCVGLWEGGLSAHEMCVMHSLRGDLFVRIDAWTNFQTALERALHIFHSHTHTKCTH